MCLGVDFSGFTLFWDAEHYELAGLCCFPHWRSFQPLFHRSIFQLRSASNFFLNMLRWMLDFLLMSCRSLGLCSFLFQLIFSLLSRLHAFHWVVLKFTDSYLLSFLLCDFFSPVILFFIYTISIWFFFITSTSLIGFFFSYVPREFVI